MINADDVTALAQKTMLGGLLLDPTPLPQVNAWVRGSDFTDPWHRTAWALMREAHVAGRPHDAMRLGAALVDRLGAARADLLRVHDLLAAVDRNPDPRPAARVLVESGVRREIAGQGVLIEAAALGAAQSHQSRGLKATMRVAGAAFLIAGERWADAHDRPIDHFSERLPSQLKTTSADLELRRAADKYLSGAPALDGDVVRDAERRLIACLATHPTAIAPTSAWLRPDQVTDRPWATVYAALVELADAGQTIDPISLTDTTQRVARTTKIAPDLLEMLETIEREQVSVPGYLRQQVAGDHLRMVAGHGASALRRAAADRSVLVPSVIETGTELVQRLARIGCALPDRIDIGGLGRSRGLEPPGADLGREGPVAG